MPEVGLRAVVLGDLNHQSMWKCLGREKKQTNMVVAQKTGIPKWLALVSGNMDQNLRFALLVNFEPHPCVRQQASGLNVLTSNLSNNHFLASPPENARVCFMNAVVMSS